jgi:HSP20 family protein
MTKVLGRVAVEIPPGAPSAQQPASAAPASAGRFPLALYEHPERYELRCDLPGVDPAEIDVQIYATNVVVRGTRRSHDPAGGSVILQEQTPGDFTRSLVLPMEISAERASASYLDGVLTVILPKAAEAKPKSVKVSRGAPEASKARRPPPIPRDVRAARPPTPQRLAVVPGVAAKPQAPAVAAVIDDAKKSVSGEYPVPLLPQPGDLSPRGVLGALDAMKG